MPRRWLSMRTHKEDQTSTLKATEGFDFAFGFKTDAAEASLASRESKRPFVFSSNPSRVRRAPDLTLLTERPSTSRSSRYYGSHSATRSESSCIGVAFGSPLHPPQNFGSAEPNMSPSNNCFVDSPSPSRTPSIKKWKKLSSLFRPRSNSEKVAQLGCHCQPQVNAESHTLGVPIHIPHWRHPRPPSNVQDDFNTHRAVPRTDKHNERPKTSHGYDASSFQKFMEAHPVPSLQVKIPGSPFERYSVMFKNINATPQLTLHHRRSRVMEETTPEPSLLHDSIDDDLPGLKRRVTSPNMSKSDETATPGPKVSGPTGYSLFPATPSSSRPQSQHRPSHSSSSRPWTAPGQVLTPHGNFPSPPTQQLRKSTSKAQLRVVDVEKDLSPPSPPVLLGARNVSGHSSGSSNGEIFFDVKSLRNSRGTDANQYEMTRPPSTELKIARSKSSARKKMLGKASISSMQEEIEESMSRSTSLQIDDAIALVESLTSASSLSVASTTTTETVAPRKIISQHQQAIAAPSEDASNAAASTTPRNPPKLKREGLSIDLPPRVLESIEEKSPKTVSSRHSIALITEDPTITRTNRLASRARANSNDTKLSRARLMQELPLPKPPTVPVKDSKLVPLSKYAPKQTAEDVVRQTGIRPARPLRSSTDNIASYNHGATVFRKQFSVERSCTMPSGSVSNPAKDAVARPIITERRSAPHMSQEAPMVVAYIKPAAEVSVARTVSLSRNASAKIISKPSVKNASRLSSHSEGNMRGGKLADRRLPTLPEVNSKHKASLSQQNPLLGSEANMPSSPMSLPSVSDFTKTLDVFPAPPSVTVGYQL